MWRGGGYLDLESIRASPRHIDGGSHRGSIDGDGPTQYTGHGQHDEPCRLRHDPRSSAAVYEASGVGPEDIKVVELHDCFAHNELISYQGLGLCDVGCAAQFIVDGENTYGGLVVTNPSGGLLSKGHPLGATGLAQCYELTHQLRGTAEARQVGGPRFALQHNLGLGGACIVTMYERLYRVTGRPTLTLRMQCLLPCSLRAAATAISFTIAS